MLHSERLSTHVVPCVGIWVLPANIFLLCVQLLHSQHIDVPQFQLILPIVDWRVGEFLCFELVDRLVTHVQIQCLVREFGSKVVGPAATIILAIGLVEQWESVCDPDSVLTRAFKHEQSINGVFTSHELDRVSDRLQGLHRWLQFHIFLTFCESCEKNDCDKDAAKLKHAWLSECLF